MYDKPLFDDRTAANIYSNVREAPEDSEDVKGLKGLLYKYLYLYKLQLLFL